MDWNQEKSWIGTASAMCITSCCWMHAECCELVCWSFRVDVGLMDGWVDGWDWLLVEQPEV
eukprot:349655-Chlamydomonas_euryale.AAC.3